MSPDRGRVLIVEDDPGIALLQRRRLERAGVRVEVAANVDTALAALGRDDVSVVVLDYRLGDTTGLDLHRRMKADGIEVPVILVSGAMEDATVVEALRAGVRDVVVKTSDYLDYLPEAVRGVIEQTSETGVRHAPRQGTCVLLVEDDPGTALLERRQLERAGYRVRIATDAEAASQEMRSGDIGLAVLDLRLPGASTGLDVYERWKREGLFVPAILVTAYADQSVAVHALRLGLRDVVPKTGDFLEYLAGAVDRVVAQVRIERKLAESELRLASIIGTTMDAIVMCDAESRVVLFNGSAEELFECAAAEVLGTPIAGLIPALALDAPAAGSFRQRRELEGTRRRSRVPVPIEVSVTDVVIEGLRHFTVIARDITERRRAEQELREADRRKDEFLGMLAHELRNPLAAVMNAGEVLHRLVTDERGQKLTAVVRRQTRTLARMVDDLLDVSRVTLGKIELVREPLLVGQAVARAIEGARHTVDRAGLELTVQIDPEPLWIEGDSTRLEQVVTNLVANAVKFTPDGGRVVVSVTGESRHAVIRVRDTGMGIAGDLVPRVFDLFVQGDASLDRSRSGLGIGLALVRKLVTLHGGTVTAASDGPGRGSEFTVRLPLAAEEVDPPPAAALAGPPVSRLRVLVVDDQVDVADSVAMLVETLGHRVSTAYDGASALAMCRESAPDVMLVDIGMPGMTGYELADRIRRDPALARLHLVAVTGYGRQEDRRRVMHAGFDAHLTKPVTDTGLSEALAAVRPAPAPPAS